MMKNQVFVSQWPLLANTGALESTRNVTEPSFTFAEKDKGIYFPLSIITQNPPMILLLPLLMYRTSRDSHPLVRSLP